LSHSGNTLTSAAPNISFLKPDIYPGISVKEMDFAANQTKPPFKSTYFEIAPGVTTPVDQHKVEEIWLVLKGSGVLEYDGRRIPITEKDVMHFASFMGHSVTNNSDIPLLICSIYW